MEKHAALKRERMEESNESGRFYEEPEASAAKRLRKETYKVDVVCEILSKMDDEEVDFEVEEIEEEMVWDMMKILQQEISQSPSSSDSDDTGTSSINVSDELVSTGECKGCSFNAEFDYILGASDDELGIPCSE